MYSGHLISGYVKCVGIYAAAKVVYNATHIHFMLEGPIFNTPIHLRLELISIMGDIQNNGFAVSKIYSRVN